MPPAIKLVDPSENEFLASLESKTKQPSPFYRAMAQRPDVLKDFVPLYKAILGPGSVDRRTKMLIYLACSYANECAYCVASNLQGAKKSGITDTETRALQTEQDQDFSAPDRAVIRYSRELTQTADASETRSALAEHFTSEQIVEITLVAAMANFTNRFNNGLLIGPEA